MPVRKCRRRLVLLSLHHLMKLLLSLTTQNGPPDFLCYRCNVFLLIIITLFSNAVVDIFDVNVSKTMSSFPGTCSLLYHWTICHFVLSLL